MAKNEFEVFPTWEEFHDFSSFIRSQETVIEKYGVLLVTPPEKWECTDKALIELFMNTEVKSRNYKFIGDSGEVGWSQEEINVSTIDEEKRVLERGETDVVSREVPSSGRRSSAVELFNTAINEPIVVSGLGDVKGRMKASGTFSRNIRKKARLQGPAEIDDEKEFDAKEDEEPLKRKVGRPRDEDKKGSDMKKIATDEDEYEFDGEERPTEKEKEGTDMENIANKDDQYEFDAEEEEEPSKRKVGRPRDKKKEVKVSSRPPKMCPLCRFITDKNFPRHLQNKHKLTLKETNAIVNEAARRTKMGLREANLNFLPTSWTESLKDPSVQVQFQLFLDDLGAVQPKEKRSKSKQEKEKEEEENEDDIEEIIEESNQEQGSEKPGKSTKQLMATLGFHVLDDSYNLIKIVKEYGEQGNQKRKDLIKNSLTIYKRVLGFVYEATNSTDEYGWSLLMEIDKIREFLKIMQTTAEASPATVANYAHKLNNLYKLSIEVFFDQPGMPLDSVQHKTLTNNLRKCQLELIGTIKELDEKKDEDLAAKKVEFGNDLPDIDEWEEYLNAKEVKELFEKSLKSLSDASDEMIQELESNPDESPLRNSFNIVVEYLATRQLFLAARPGELTKCTYKELTSATSFRDCLHINVAKHKTGRIKQAVIRIEKEDKENFYQYTAILKRFKTKINFGFPFLSPTKGFVEHTNIYRRLNNWLKKADRNHFTCTKMRKVVETHVDAHGTLQQQKVVGSALQHGPKAVHKSYRCDTSEKVDNEKDTVQEVKNDKFVRKILAKKEFPVDAFKGPFDEIELRKYFLSAYNIQVSISESLYELYRKFWLEAYEPKLITLCKEELENGTPLDEIKEIFNDDFLLPIKANVLLALRN